MLLHGDLFVRDKYVVSLGCNCGCIGITAILMGASKILFADESEAYFNLIKNNAIMVEDEHEFVA